MGKTYRGRMTVLFETSVTVHEGGQGQATHQLRTSADARFNWGHGRHDPGNRLLARALLADELGVHPSEDMILAFADEIVQRLANSWALDGDDIKDWAVRRAFVQG